MPWGVCNDDRRRKTMPGAGIRREIAIKRQITHFLLGNTLTIQIIVRRPRVHLPMAAASRLPSAGAYR